MPIVDDLQTQLEALLAQSKSSSSTSTSSTPIAGLSMNVATTKSKELFEYPKYRDTDGKLVYGSRLENHQPGHNKEYTITVTSRPLAGASSKPASGAEYIVEGAWGAIGAALSKQIKDIDGKKSTSNRARALETAQDLERAKKAKGYEVKFVMDSDLVDDLAPSENSDDWTVIDDLIVDPYAEVPAAEFEEVDRECYCYTVAEELSHLAYTEPELATLEIAPLLMQPGYGLVRFEDAKRGARWIITVLSTCNPYPEPHARAIPVGDSMKEESLKDRKRSTAQYVEELVVDFLVEKSPREFDLTILVEESGIDLVIVDAYRWGGENLLEQPWTKRRHTMDTSFSEVFKSQKKGSRKVTIAPRIVTRLREEYLAEGDKVRFELHDNSELPGGLSWSLPRL